MAADGQAGHDLDAHLDLMPVDADGQATMATHVAVTDGDWFDPATWADGQVPGDGALVHIPAGIAVSYQGASEAGLFMVRVDGGLTITARDGTATKMVVDTIITAPASTLVVDARADDAGTVDIVFAQGTPAAYADFYTDQAAGAGVNGRYDWDPSQLSLGLVAAGSVDVRGQEIVARGQLATGPQAGAIEIVLDMDAAGAGWAPGDKIVVGGVAFAGRGADGTMATEDEVRTIVDVRAAGAQTIVTLDRPLEYDHSGPADPATGLELTGYVGNLTRNVTFSSAVADGDGDGAPERAVSLDELKEPGQHYVTERGHIMFMHNDDVVVQDIAISGLGRTDKSIGVDDVQTAGERDAPIYANGGDPGAFEPGLDIKQMTPAEEMANPRGRYALHIHMANERGAQAGPAGHEDATDGAWVEGVAVWGSPGWGIVQHASDAVLKDNVVFDVAGSAFVSETGDETGRWTGNLAIGTYGARDQSDNEDSDDFNGDGGGSGNGFYMKSRALALSDNVAQSSARAGFFWHTEGGNLRDPVSGKLGAFAVNANHAATIAADRVAIQGFQGNTVIAARQGIRIIASPDDSVRKYNDVYSLMTDFTAWEIDSDGVSVTYSSKYIFRDFLILGTAVKQSDDAQAVSSGFTFKASVADITVLESHVENFTNAVTNWTQVGDRQEFRRGYWDPKLPADNPYVDPTTGLGHVQGIENAVYNLWNTNIIGLTYDNLGAGPVRVPGVTIALEDGTEVRQRGYLAWETADEIAGRPDIGIELIDDSRDGGLVALWREDIANDPDQRAMLQTNIPLAYRNTLYLGQFTGEDGSVVARWNYGDYVKGINDDIWSGTVLEFAKTDSLGRQVFTYGDFAPLEPHTAERAVTTNERLVFSKEEVDATLVKEGYYTVRGIDDVKFVIMREQFSDRLTGQTETVEILVALDLAWDLPAGTRDAGLLLIHDQMVIAPQYAVFMNGVLDPDRAPITLAPPENTLGGGGFAPSADLGLPVGAPTAAVAEEAPPGNPAPRGGMPSTRDECLDVCREFGIGPDTFVFEQSAGEEGVADAKGATGSQVYLPLPQGFHAAGRTTDDLYTFTEHEVGQITLPRPDAADFPQGDSFLFGPG